VNVAETLGGLEAAFVDAARVARLATSMPDATPHVIPVCPVLDLDRILIASAYDQKVANIRETPAVCIAFDEYSEDWEHGLSQVIVWGEAYLVEGGPEFERDANLLNEKFPQYPVSTYPIEEGTTVIIEIRPMRVSSSGL
jgi:nitroimidazol reductase NimA-like FMN-containing flavoprotein (pyridoxamine 5'-phosphate oxidase superfamily)